MVLVTLTLFGAAPVVRVSIADSMTGGCMGDECDSYTGDSGDSHPMTGGATKHLTI